MAQLRRWNDAYGANAVTWLPPAGYVRLAKTWTSSPPAFRGLTFELSEAMTGDTMTADEQLQPAGHGLLKRGYAPSGASWWPRCTWNRRGCYVGVPGVDPWDADQRRAQSTPDRTGGSAPPCQRWGRFWQQHAQTHQYTNSATTVVAEARVGRCEALGWRAGAPARKTWDSYRLMKPKTGAGWEFDFTNKLWMCYVEQGTLRALQPKPTWLIIVGCVVLGLADSAVGQDPAPACLDDRALRLQKASASAWVAMVGGKNKTAIPQRPPKPFRDLLLLIARRRITTELCRRRSA